MFLKISFERKYIFYGPSYTNYHKNQLVSSTPITIRPGTNQHHNRGIGDTNLAAGSSATLSAVPRSSGHSRRYLGPVRFPVTPLRGAPPTPNNTLFPAASQSTVPLSTYNNNDIHSAAATSATAVVDRRPATAHRLSLLAASDDSKAHVFI